MLSGGNTKYSDPERQRIARTTAPVEKDSSALVLQHHRCSGLRRASRERFATKRKADPGFRKASAEFKKKHCNLSALVSFARTLWQPQQRYKERGMPYTAK